MLSVIGSNAGQQWTDGEARPHFPSMPLWLCGAYEYIGVMGGPPHNPQHNVIRCTCMFTKNTVNTVDSQSESTDRLLVVRKFGVCLPVSVLVLLWSPFFTYYSRCCGRRKEGESSWSLARAGLFLLMRISPIGFHRAFSERE